MIETINIVNKEVSKVLKKDEELVKAVNKFYWKKGIKETVQRGDTTSIWIRNLGTLVVSRSKIRQRITRTIKIIRNLRQRTEFKLKTREEYLEEKYKILRMLLARRNDIAIAYKANTERGKQRHEVSKTSMGEQTPDNAGTNSQDILFE